MKFKVCVELNHVFPSRFPLSLNRKERNEASLIDAELANAKCPQVVIRYLSEKIIWNEDNED